MLLDEKCAKCGVGWDETPEITRWVLADEHNEEHDVFLCDTHNRELEQIMRKFIDTK